MTITFLPSPNFSHGRNGKIDSIVVHWMAGTLANTDAEFTHGSRKVSAHYGVEGTTVHQYVHDFDTAWHAGDWNENQRSIGIEHSAGPGRPATAETVATSVALMVTLCREYSIDPGNIFPHKKFFPTQCPGTLPLAAMVAAVRAQLAAPHTAPAAPSRGAVRPPLPVAADAGQVRAIQAAVHVPADGMWGPHTSAAAEAVILHTGDVRLLQGYVGTRVDGAWGPASEAARIAAIKKIQAAIHVSPDGVWGPLSKTAWLVARNRNYNRF